MTAPVPSLSVRITPHQDSTNAPTALLAFAELVIAESFVIKGIRILARRDGEDRLPFVVFPAEKGKGRNDRWYDIAHPVTPQARIAAVALVLEAFKIATQEKPA
jgi:DNA-binding cell septation regulator SpoVG